MRLSEVQAILYGVIESSNHLKIEKANSENIIIGNILAFKSFINDISVLPFFENEIKFITNSKLYSTSQSTFTIRNDIGYSIYKTAEYLNNASEALSKVLEVMNPNIEENSIFILLPCTNDFKALVNNLTAFEKSINQVISNDTIKGQLRIKRWESGSFWVELMLGSQAAVSLIAAIAWSATVISKKYKESQLIEQHVRSLEIKNESLQDLLEKQKEVNSLLIQNEVKNIQVKHFGSNEDNENFERLRLTTKTFAELIQKGSEVHPALNAPEEVQNVFPNFKKLGSIVSQIKQIEENTSKSN
ncbi:MAG: hypothetical protein PF482_15220, partial [Desulfobacteraceae bacterium]|jgi:hypothetical protein|nr:hypothetical protein [Desulfobacteraceae bacterium]